MSIFAANTTARGTGWTRWLTLSRRGGGPIVTRAGLIHEPCPNWTPGLVPRKANFRRIATRYDKTALSFAAMLALAAAMIWLR